MLRALLAYLKNMSLFIFSSIESIQQRLNRIIKVSDF